MGQHVVTKQVQFRQHQLPPSTTCYFSVCRALQSVAPWSNTLHRHTTALISTQTGLHLSAGIAALVTVKSCCYFLLSSLLIDSIYCNHIPKDITGLSLRERAGPCTGEWTFIYDVLVCMTHEVPQNLKIYIKLLWLLDIISLQTQQVLAN